MGRRLDHYEPKRQYTLTIPETIAVWIQLYGGGNINIGLLEAIRHVTDVDALYPPGLVDAAPYECPLVKSHEERKAEADRGARWVDDQAGPRLIRSGRAMTRLETSEERIERIRKNSLQAARIQSEVYRELRVNRHEDDILADAQHYFNFSRREYEAGRPLPNHTQLEMMGTTRSMAIRAEVFRRCKAEFGWESGPKPQEKRQEPALISVRETPIGTITRVDEDYSDVFDVPRGPALRVNQEGQLEPATVDAAETKAPDPETETPKGETNTPILETETADAELSTADTAGAADSGTIGTDGLPEPSF